jgi:hypothetical protein
VKLRYQADNDLDQRIVSAVRRIAPEIDFRTAVASGLHEGIQDPDVLSMSADHGRVLVTHDRRTMSRHFAEFIATRHSPGLVIVSQHLAIGRAAEWLHLMWATTEAEEYIDIVYEIR